MICVNCEYCFVRSRSEMQCGEWGRKHYHCKNPETKKLKDKNGYQLLGFIGFGTSSYESPLTVKTSPRWCPLKKKLN